MNINDWKIGDMIELKVVTPLIRVPHIAKVKVHGIYPKFIVFDNGKWRFSGLKFDLINDEVIIA